MIILKYILFTCRSETHFPWFVLFSIIYSKRILLPLASSWKTNIRVFQNTAGTPLTVTCDLFFNCYPNLTSFSGVLFWHLVNKKFIFHHVLCNCNFFLVSFNYFYFHTQGWLNYFQSLVFLTFFLPWEFKIVESSCFIFSESSIV